MLIVRQELPQDQAAVYSVVSAAFERADEADLVNRLRPLANTISLVAEDDNGLIGHIMFSPVSLIGSDDRPIDIKIAGLAPVAVAPDHQKIGVGKSLIKAGLAACQAAGFVACVLIGHPGYYPKFGFKPAHSTYKIKSTYDVPDPVFMAVELAEGALKDHSGMIHYHSVFNGI